MVSPQSPPPPIPAGMSSAGLGITQEPAVGMKKKPVHVESNVTLGDKDQQIPQEEVCGGPLNYYYCILLFKI